MSEEIVLSKDTHIKTENVERAVDTPADFTSPEVLYDDLIATIRKYHPSSELSDIEKAYKIARDAHEGQKRKSGEPYIIHPLCVGIILDWSDIYNSLKYQGLSRSVHWFE